jgi:hypothetical protein
VRWHRRGLAGALVALLSVTACTSTTDISDPVEAMANPLLRKTAWFSFLNGDDIRARCHAGAPDHLRLVHNANYSRQVRIYDIMAASPDRPDGPPPGTLSLTTRVIGGPTNRWLVDAGDPSSLFAPWAGQASETVLAQRVMSVLRIALAGDGLSRPAPAGTEVFSQNYWWLAVGCLDGEVRFQVWARPFRGYPDRGYDDLTFPAVLQARDGTGVPFRTPADEPAHANPAVMDRDGASREVRFRLAVGPDGLNP